MKKILGFYLNILLMLNILIFIVILCLYSPIIYLAISDQIPIFYLIEFNDSYYDIVMIYLIYTYIFNNIFRNIAIFKNFILMLNRTAIKEIKQLKNIFYFNFLSLILFIFLIYFKFTFIYLAFNIFILYPEVVITTLFNIPILYVVSNKIIKYKIIVLLIRISLILMFIYNIYLLIDGEFLQSIIWLP